MGFFTNSIQRLLQRFYTGGMDWYVLRPPLNSGHQLEPLEPRVLLSANHLFSVNAGGPEITGEARWLPDVPPSIYSNKRDSKSTVGETADLIDLTNSSVPSNTPAALFQTYRKDKFSGQEMEWEFPVGPGKYEVQLYFSESRRGYDNIGDSVFDVYIEDGLVLSNYDIIKEAGGTHKAIVESFVLQSDSILDIAFDHVSGHPVINAIAIIPTTNVNTLSSSASNLDFGTVFSDGSASRQLVLSNSGADAGLDISVIAAIIDGNHSEYFLGELDHLAGLVLSPEESTRINLNYSPLAAGLHDDANLLITHSGEGGFLSIGLRGLFTTNNAPELFEIDNASVSAGESVAIGITAVDIDGDDLVFSAEGLPDFVSLSDNGKGIGSLMLNPQETDVGVYEGIVIWVTDNETPALSDSHRLVITVSSSGDLGKSYRVNAGGPELEDVLYWTSDRPSVYSNKKSSASRGSHSDASINLTHTSIPYGIEEELFQSQRWDKPGGEEMQWEFVIDPGQYEVQLYFSENNSQLQNIGSRVFDVLIEGNIVLNNYDIYSEAGAGFKGVSESFVITSDDTIDIDFARVTDNPTISGIAISPLNARNRMGTSSDSISFGSVPVGMTGTEQITLQNLGVAGDPPITINSIKVSQEESSAFNLNSPLLTDLVLNPGNESIIDVSFNPTGVQTETGIIEIQHSGTNSPFQVEIRGEGVGGDENNPPILEEIVIFPFKEGVNSEIVLRAYDPDGDAISFSLVNYPDFMSIEDNGDGTSLIHIMPGVGDAGNYAGIIVKVSDSGSPSLNDMQAINLEIDPDSVEDIVYRVNAGNFAISDEPIWLGDKPASEFTNADAAASRRDRTGANIDLTDPSIPLGTPEALFQTNRWDHSVGAEMKWDFPVSPGQYEVRLYFSEIFDEAFEIGERVFDVFIEGQLKLDNFDIFLEAGGGEKGITRTFVIASDNNLDIDFEHVLENPSISGIEIVRAPQKNTLAATVSVVDFGNVSMSETNKLPVTLVHLGGSFDDNITVTSTSIDHPEVFQDNFLNLQRVTLSPGDLFTFYVSLIPNGRGSKNSILTINHSGSNAPVNVKLMGEVVPDIPIGFNKSVAIHGSIEQGTINPTSLQWGPDGLLYVGHQYGLITAYEIVKDESDGYVSTLQHKIDLVQKIPNHNDDGTPFLPAESNEIRRLLTGILVSGTPENPVVFASSSDWRIGGQDLGTDTDVDTNSGIFSRLSWNGLEWDKIDLVRGLPRSEENHASNGIALDASSNIIYLAQGGHTNMGAPSQNFVFLPEYALSGAILSIDLNLLDTLPAQIDPVRPDTDGDGIDDNFFVYDIPTLDDDTRNFSNGGSQGDQQISQNIQDVFGGNKGRNQAILVDGGPVQVYAPGFRNAYDVLLSEAGRLYTIDNGPNGGWGGPPITEAGTATNEPNEIGSVTHPDGLHLLTESGYYGGHPNPTRANEGNTFNSRNPQSPVSQIGSNAIEGEYQIPGVENDALTTFEFSTNGLVEYTSNEFDGALRGDILAASFDNSIIRIKLNSSGDKVAIQDILLTSVGVIPLDITAVGDNGVDGLGLFSGSIWVADIVTNEIIGFEPNRNIGNSGIDDDHDGDGYTNTDEHANGTNSYSAADFPEDYDRDFISNLLDNDDDNDLLSDEEDFFPLDSENGRNTLIGKILEFDQSDIGTIENMGFTGLMIDPLSKVNYEDLYNKVSLTAGGASNIFTIDAAGLTSARGATNAQKQGFQFGFNPSDEIYPYAAFTRILNPFGGRIPLPGQEIGFYIGEGDQSNYIQLAVTGNHGGRIELIREFSDVDTVIASNDIEISSIEFIDFILTVDPLNKTVQGSYVINMNGVFGQRKNIGSAIDITNKGWESRTLATGLVANSPYSINAPEVDSLPATWERLGVTRHLPNTLGVSDSTVDFGDAPVNGNGLRREIRLTNLGLPGDVDLAIKKLAISGNDADDFSKLVLDSDSIALSPGESITIGIEFIPIETGNKTATLSIDHSGVNNSSIIELLGSGLTAVAGGTLKIEPRTGGIIKASTLTDKTFVITNSSTAGQQIEHVTIDLRSSMFPNMVFDPYGRAGDIGWVKSFRPNGGDKETGLIGHRFLSDHSDGFDVLQIDFDDFNPGEIFYFSIDVDPTSISGVQAPGPNFAGAVSGLELIGTTITFEFNDALTLSGQMYLKQDSKKGSVLSVHSLPLPPDPPSAIEVIGVSDPTAIVSSPEQTVRIYGNSGDRVRVLVIEAGLYLEGVPEARTALEIFESNVATAFSEYSGFTIGDSGLIDVAITLTKTEKDRGVGPNGLDGGINHVIAVTESSGGSISRLSNMIVLEFFPDP